LGCRRGGKISPSLKLSNDFKQLRFARTSK
jgi:hypothetical protein